MRSRLALGLMSGTSADGLSLALIAVKGASVTVRAETTRAYSKALRARILAAPSLRAAELSSLHFELGRFYAREAARFLKGLRISPRRLEAVGSHGQTVAHESGVHSLQIGEPSFLAEALGVPVVSDFRPRDVAAGGLGAPIVPFFDEEVFGRRSPRVMLNIGGIANLALVGKGLRTLGFDIGPGNCMIDLAVTRMSGGALGYDRGGRIALRGRADEALVRRLSAREPYFRARAPKSLDRSTFSERYLSKNFKRGQQPDVDTVATVTLFTAAAIADAVRRFVLPRATPKEVVVSGGGALNAALMGALRRLLSPTPVLSIAEFGIPALAKEPAAIALMALRAVKGKPNHCPAATGARGPRILGKLTF